MPFAGEIVLSLSLTPSARSAAVDVTEETYDVTTALAAYSQNSAPFRLLTTDSVSIAGNPSGLPAAHVGIVGVRAASATTIAVAWGNFTAAANVPPSGTYSFRVSRL